MLCSYGNLFRGHHIPKHPEKLRVNVGQCSALSVEEPNHFSQIHIVPTSSLAAIDTDSHTCITKPW